MNFTKTFPNEPLSNERMHVIHEKKVGYLSPLKKVSCSEAFLIVLIGTVRKMLTGASKTMFLLQLESDLKQAFVFSLIFCAVFRGDIFWSFGNIGL